jgi:hypothetical protein
MVQLYTAWYSWVQYAKHGTVGYSQGTTLYSMVQHGTIQYSMVKHGKAWESIRKHGIAWYRIHRIQHGTAQYRIVRMVQHSTSW